MDPYQVEDTHEELVWFNTANIRSKRISKAQIAQSDARIHWYAACPRRQGCQCTTRYQVRVRQPNTFGFITPMRRSLPPNLQADCFRMRPPFREVISKRTRRTDEGEKKDAYLTIPSLCAYLLVEQESPAVVVFRRTDTGFVREVYTGLDAVVWLGEIEIELPLADVYDGVEFIPETADDEETT